MLDTRDSATRSVEQAVPRSTLGHPSSSDCSFATQRFASFFPRALWNRRQGCVSDEDKQLGAVIFLGVTFLTLDVVYAGTRLIRRRRVRRQEPHWTCEPSYTKHDLGGEERCTGHAVHASDAPRAAPASDSSGELFAHARIPAAPSDNAPAMPFSSVTDRQHNANDDTTDDGTATVNNRDTAVDVIHNSHETGNGTNDRDGNDATHDAPYRARLYWLALVEAIQHGVPGSGGTGLRVSQIHASTSADVLRLSHSSSADVDPSAAPLDARPPDETSAPSTNTTQENRLGDRLILREETNQTAQTFFRRASMSSLDASSTLATSSTANKAKSTTTLAPTLSASVSLLPSSSAVMQWNSAYALWIDAVRYSVNTDEIREVLRHTQSAHMLLRACCTSLPSPTSQSITSGPLTVHERLSLETAFAAANLALLWHLELLRRVYEAVVRHDDTAAAKEDLDEMTQYGPLFYRRFVEPWGEGYVDVGEAMAAALVPTPYSNSNRSDSDRSHKDANDRNMILIDSDGTSAHTKNTGDNKDNSSNNDTVDDTGVVDLHDADVTDGVDVSSVENDPIHVVRQSDVDGDSRAVHTGQEDVRDTALTSQNNANNNNNIRNNDGAPDRVFPAVRACAPRRCWHAMQAARDRLIWLRHRRAVAHVGNLFRYLYATATAKYGGVLLMLMATSVTARVTAAQGLLHDTLTQWMLHFCNYTKNKHNEYTSYSSSVTSSADGAVDSSLPSASAQRPLRATWEPLGKSRGFVKDRLEALIARLTRMWADYDTIRRVGGISLSHDSLTSWLLHVRCSMLAHLFTHDKISQDSSGHGAGGSIIHTAHTDCSRARWSGDAAHHRVALENPVRISSHMISGAPSRTHMHGDGSTVYLPDITDTVRVGASAHKGNLSTTCASSYACIHARENSTTATITTAAAHNSNNNAENNIPDRNGAAESSESWQHVVVMHLLVYLLLEVIRWGVEAVLTQVVQHFIRTAAAQRRDVAKAQLYEALTHLPMPFYNTHGYDAIEEMVYFVNDLEGVDVQMQQFVFALIRALTAVRSSMQRLSGGTHAAGTGTARDLRCATLLGALLLWGLHSGLPLLWRAGTRLAEHMQRAARMHIVGNCDTYRRDEEDDEDAECSEFESDADAAMMAENGGYAAGHRGGCAGVGGVMLGGLDIIAALPQLRPYGADVTLMRWWNAFTGAGRRLRRHARTRLRPYSDDADVSNAYSSKDAEVNHRAGHYMSSYLSRARAQLRSLHHHFTPALGRGFAATAQWLLRDGWVYCASATNSVTQPRVMSDALAALEELGRVVTVESVGVWGVIRHQAYKANVLCAILDSHHWEEEEEEHDDGEDAGESGSTAESQTSEGERDGINLVSPKETPASALYNPSTLHDVRRKSNPLHRSGRRRRNMLYEICIKHLRFRYPATPTLEVFDPPLSLRLVLHREGSSSSITTTNTSHTTFTAGQLVCLTGRSGCGKSTLFALLLGLYRVHDHTHSDTVTTADDNSNKNSNIHTSRNAACGDGNSHSGTSAIYLQFGPPDSHSPAVNIDSVPRHRLRRRIFAHLPQRPFLIAGATLAQNISLRNMVTLSHTAILHRVRQCAQLAHCDFVSRLPQGCMTCVSDALSGGSGGNVVTLSGGQAQRVMLARALYHRAQVLLMDEPTANLDPQTRQELVLEWKALLRQGVVTGILCCTHDEALMQAADSVVSM